MSGRPRGGSRGLVPKLENRSNRLKPSLPFDVGDAPRQGWGTAASKVDRNHATDTLKKFVKKITNPSHARCFSHFCRSNRGGGGVACGWLETRCGISPEPSATDRSPNLAPLRPCHRSWDLRIARSRAVHVATACLCGSPVRSSGGLCSRFAMAPGKSEGAESSTAELLGCAAFQAPPFRYRNIAVGGVAPPEQTTHGRIGPPVNRLRGAERPNWYARSSIRPPVAFRSGASIRSRAVSPAGDGREAAADMTRTGSRPQTVPVVKPSLTTR